MTDNWLRALAEKATGGPWHVVQPKKNGNFRVQLTPHLAVCETFGNSLAAECDSAFIAAANPQAILSLLDRVEKAEGAPEGYALVSLEPTEEMYRQWQLLAITPSPRWLDKWWSAMVRAALPKPERETTNPHSKWLLKAAEEIRKEGHFGWGNTCEQAAAEIARLRAELTASATKKTVKIIEPGGPGLGDDTGESP